MYAETKEIAGDPIFTTGVIASCFLAHRQTEIGNLLTTDNYKKVSQLSSLIFSVNDYCDIGIPAEDKRGHGDQYRFQGLLELQNRLISRMDQARLKLEGSIGQDNVAAEVVRCYIDDSISLAKSRGNTSLFLNKFQKE